MGKKKHLNMEPYIVSLARFMDGRIGLKPFPKVRLSNRNQGEDNLFIKTGYYDPEERKVTVFVHDRNLKDILRSVAHELVHHRQNLEGRLKPGSYSGEVIVEDDRLMELEKEAYLNGNILFRMWTETLQKGEIENDFLPHMRKKIKVEECKTGILL